MSESTVEKKKLLIITQYYIPDITAAAYRINDMYEAIKNQYDIDILTSFPHKSKEVVNENAENIHRVRIGSKHKNKYIKYLNDYFGFMLKAILRSRKLSKQYDYVFATSPPIFSLVAGYYIARRKKAKFILDIRDLWPDVLIDDNTLNEKSYIFKLVKKLELFLYGKADYITCVSKYMREQIEKLSGKQCSVIYNGISESSSTFKNIDRFKSKTSLKLVYAGNMGYFQHLDVLADLVDNSIEEKFQIELIGGGTMVSSLKEKTYKNGLAIKFHNPMRKEKLNSYIEENADALFLNLYNSKTLQRTIPSKLFDYLYFNLPIIYGIKGEGKEILDRLGCGVAFEWNNERSLKHALLELYKKL